MSVSKLATLSLVALFFWAYLALPERVASTAPYTYVSAKVFFNQLPSTLVVPTARGLPSSVVSVACEPLGADSVGSNAYRAGFACTLVTEGDNAIGLPQVFMQHGWPFPSAMTDFRAGRQFWEAATIFPWAQVALQALLVGVLALSLIRSAEFKASMQVPTRLPAVALLPAGVMAARLALPMFALGLAVPSIEACSPSSVAVSTIALTLLVAPVCEELLFRGWGYALLKRVFSERTTILVTGGLFALFHIVGGISDHAGLAAIQVLGFVAIGLSLGVVRSRTGSVMACIGAHMLANLLVILRDACT